MALNVSMLKSSGQARTRQRYDKLIVYSLYRCLLFHVAEGVTITLALLGAGHSASGAALASNVASKAYVTSQRLVVVADAALSSSSAPFQSLTVPLSHCIDGRLVQPIFGAPRWEVTIRPVAQGGLRTPHHLTIWFTGSRAWEFVSAVDECKRRYDEEAGAAGPEGESLPAYVPPPEIPARPESSSSRPSAARQASLPSADLLEAADTARQAEAVEDASHSGFAPVQAGQGEGPPAYDLSTRPTR